MRALVKGIKMNVTVNVSIGEIRETTNEDRKGETPRVRSSENYASDVNLNAGVGLELESYEGEIDLSELSEMVKTCLTDSIREQVKEEMQNASTPDTTDEGVIHNVDGNTPPTKEEMEDDGELY